MREALSGLVVAIAAMQALAGSPAAAVSTAYADCRRLPSDAQAHARYLSLYDDPADGRPLLIHLAGHQLNSVSTDSEFVHVVVVAPDLIRFDVRDPGPAFTVAWEKTADVDPIFHLTVEVEEIKEQEYGHFEEGSTKGGWPQPKVWVTAAKKKEKTGKKVRKGVLATEVIEGCPTCRGWLPTKETVELAYLTQSRSPILSAQWWHARSSRVLNLDNQDDGCGYYALLGAKTRADFFKIAHIREEDRVRIIRAVVEAGTSGIAENGRQIERDEAAFGPYWFTLDVDHASGEQNVTHQLKRGELSHQAEEWYVHLPNGLPATFLSKDDGELQATAPDFIGANGIPAYGGRDLRIHAGTLSCADCHAKEVLFPIDDWARKTFAGNVKLQSPDYQTTRDFQREFFSNLEKKRALDAAGFIDAIEESSGLKIEKLVTANSAQWRLYANTPLDADAFGRMLGCDGKAWIAAVKEYREATGGIDPVFAPFLADKPGTINRKNAEEFFYLAQTVMRGTQP